VSHQDIEAVCIAWRMAIRRIWKIPRSTHSILLPRLNSTVPLIDMFYKRMLKLVYQCLTSESPLVCSFIRHAILQGQVDSVIGRNVLYCCSRYHVKIDDILTSAFRPCDTDKCITVYDDCTAIGGWLHELLLCRDGMLRLSSSDFLTDDLLIMINFLCVN
jgi:hypothetical protein